MCVNFSNIYVQKTVVLSKTKESKDKILNLCYPWGNTHGCWTPRSPQNTGNTGNLAEMEKFGFCVICMGVLSTKHFLQLFPVI